MGYENLPELIQRVKVAAIDAYMCEGGPAFQMWSNGGESYMYVDRSGQPSASVQTVSKPDQTTGEGGGVHEMTSLGFITQSMGDTYVSRFNTIRSSIDAIMDGWDELPDPTVGFPEAVEASSRVTTELSGAAAVTDGSIEGTGTTLTSNLQAVQNNLLNMASHTLGAAYELFISRLSPVCGGLHAVSVVQGLAAAGQQAIWTNARLDIVEALENAILAFNNVTTHGGETAKVLLKIFGWGLDAAGIFAKGHAKAAVEVGGLGIDILSDIVNAGDPPAVYGDISSASFQEAMDTFGDVVARIEEEISTAERKIRNNLRANIDYIVGNRRSFDLSLDASNTDLNQESGLSMPDSADDIISDASNMSIDQGRINNVTDTYMPAVSSVLSTASTDTRSATLNSTVTFPSKIGLGASGPKAPYTEINMLLETLLSDLAWDVDRGAEQLKAAIDEIFGADEDGSVTFADVNESIQGGSGENPYDAYYDPDDPTSVYDWEDEMERRGA